MPKKGIDISEFQTVRDYAKVKQQIDFMMIRAGFGFCTIDKQFHQNLTGCRENGIPYGCYWFSYACTPDDARKEAEFFCDLLDKYAKPSLPVYIDWEYDSDRYAKQQGYTITGEVLRKIAIEFLNICNDRGYKAGIYTNPDFIQRYFYSAEWCRNIGSLWLAAWGSQPGTQCDIWQYSSTGRIDGISGDVDLDLCYLDIQNTHSDRTIETILEELLDTYWDLCEGVMEGKYGSGSERKEKLGKYYEVVQTIINQAYKRKEGLF